MTDHVALEDAVPGRRYRVTWNDCCARGSFEAELLACNPSDDGTVTVDSLTFANGATVEGFGYALEEVPARAFSAAGAPVGAVVRVRMTVERKERAGDDGCVLVKTEPGIWAFPYEGDEWLLDKQVQQWTDRRGYDLLWPLP